MRLNIDCVRNILLCVEENTGLRTYCTFIDLGLENAQRFIGETIEPKDYQMQLLEEYGNDVLIYHIHYCIKADLLEKADISVLAPRLFICRQCRSIIAPNNHKRYKLLQNSE